ncbi:hypothetical protein PS2_023663 [Malus domestica]
MKFRRNMAAISLDPRLNLQATRKPNQHGVVLEEIEGLIRVHKDGYVEKPPMFPSVPSILALPSGVAAKDVVIDKFTNLWAPPDNRLPAAYDDGFKALMWVKQQALNKCSEQKRWLSKCNLSCLLIGGDGAVANIAYNVTTHLGVSRDHPWCNPLAKASVAKLRDLRLPSMMVCVSELDILKDRNFELCNALSNMRKRVETTMHKGVLHNYQFFYSRTQELISHIKAFTIKQ